MTDKLKPCPFCGIVPTPQVHIGHHPYSRDSVFISCCHNMHISMDAGGWNPETKSHIKATDDIDAMSNITELWNKRKGRI